MRRVGSMLFCGLLLSVAAVLAGERYLYVRLDDDASEQTKKDFKKWVMSLSVENWHGIDQWDTKDTNWIWHVNLDVTKPRSPWKPLTITTNSITNITSKLPAGEKAKVTAEAHSSRPKTLMVSTNKVSAEPEPTPQGELIGRNKQGGVAGGR